MSTTLLDVPTGHYIGGERVSSRERFETINPYTQEVITDIARAGDAEVDLAVRAAHDAFPAWAALGAAGRAAHLHRLADLIDANVERLPPPPPPPPPPPRRAPPARGRAR